jgi:hypothetical protein
MTLGIRYANTLELAMATTIKVNGVDRTERHPSLVAVARCAWHDRHEVRPRRPREPNVVKCKSMPAS